MSRHNYTAEFQIIDNYDEDNVLTFEVDVSFNYTPGTPESGRLGPPEYYDPGSGSEVEFDAKDLAFFETLKDGRRVRFDPWQGLVQSILEKLDDHKEHMEENI